MASVKHKPTQSMATWFSPKKSVSTKIDLHFNLWRLKDHDRASRDFLDIGVMITAPTGLDEIHFYLPFEIAKSDVVDLGSKFTESELATSIFNEKLAAKNSSAAVVQLTRESDSTTYCYVYKLPSVSSTSAYIDNSVMAVEKRFEGTEIVITNNALSAACSAIEDDERLYIRFRVFVPDDAFVNSSIPQDRFFLSGFDVVECLDLRLNETRNLPPGLRPAMVAARRDSAVVISRLDFLLAVRVTADFVGGYRDFHKCRLLESGAWNDYADDAEIPNGMVVYHWREIAGGGSSTDTKSTIEDFNAFVKLRQRVSGRPTIRAYLAAAVAIGVFVGLIGNGTYDLIKMGGSWALERAGFRSVAQAVSPRVADDESPREARPTEAAPGNAVECPRGANLPQSCANLKVEQTKSDVGGGTSVAGVAKGELHPPPSPAPARESSSTPTHLSAPPKAKAKPRMPNRVSSKSHSDHAPSKPHSGGRN
jgi:hypothetical protein